MKHEREKNVKDSKEALREVSTINKESHNEFNALELKIDFAIRKYEELSVQKQCEDVDNEQIVEY